MFAGATDSTFQHTASNGRLQHFRRDSCVKTPNRRLGESKSAVQAIAQPEMVRRHDAPANARAAACGNSTATKQSEG